MTDNEQAAADDAVMNNDNDSDLAIAIAEHAFRAGYEAACTDVALCKGVVSWHIIRTAELEKAWDAYAPSEELCGRSFATLTVKS